MSLVNEDGLPAANKDSLVGAMSGVFMVSVSWHHETSFSLFALQAGGVIGLAVNIWVMDKYGRKIGLIVASLMGLLGAAGTTGARNVAMFIVFRFFAGWGSWAALAVGMEFDLSPAPSQVLTW